MRDNSSRTLNLMAQQRRGEQKMKCLSLIPVSYSINFCLCVTKSPKSPVVQQLRGRKVLLCSSRGSIFQVAI